LKQNQSKTELPGQHVGSGQQHYFSLFNGHINHIYYMSRGHISHMSHLAFIVRWA